MTSRVISLWQWMLRYTASGVAWLVGISLAASLVLRFLFVPWAKTQPWAADPDMASFLGSHFDLFSIPLSVVSIGMFVLAIVLVAVSTRTMIGQSATRRELALALGLWALVATGVVVVIAAAAAIEHGTSPVLAANSWLIGPSNAVASGLAGAAFVAATALVVLAGLAFGTWITTMFLRFPWVVGVSVLVAMFALVPILGEVVPPFGAFLQTVTSSLWFAVAAGILAVGAYWLTLRRLPVA